MQNTTFYKQEVSNIVFHYILDNNPNSVNDSDLELVIMNTAYLWENPESDQIDYHKLAIECFKQYGVEYIN